MSMLLQQRAEKFTYNFVSLIILMSVLLQQRAEKFKQRFVELLMRTTSGCFNAFFIKKYQVQWM